MDRFDKRWHLNVYQILSFLSVSDEHRAKEHQGGRVFFSTRGKFKCFQILMFTQTSVIGLK